MLVLVLAAGALFMTLFAISAVMLSSEISASERAAETAAVNESYPADGCGDTEGGASC